MASRHGLQWMRAVTLLASAGLVLVASNFDDKVRVAVLLVAGAVVQFLLVRIARDRSNVTTRIVVCDVTLASLIMAIQPELWPAVALWLGSVLTWQAIVLPQRTSVAVSAYAVVATASAGLTADLPYWWLAASTQVFVIGAFTMFGWEMRRELAENEDDLLAAIRAAGAVASYIDVETGRVLHLEGDVERLTGYTHAEWLRLDHRTLIHPDDVGGYWITQDTPAAPRLLDRTGRFLRADGSWMWLRDIARVSTDRRGRTVMRGFFFDVTESQEHSRALARTARLDVLTELPNRLALIEQLSSLIAAGTHFALLLIDLDRFKEVNDTLGHEAGDLILNVVADRLRSAIGPNDHLARLGGDEFAIIVHGATGEEDIAAVLERIVSEASRPIGAFGIQLALSMSTGVAFTAAGADRATLLRHADIAMYEAKRSGGTHRVFDDSLEHTSTMQLSLSAALTDALADGDIRLYFQPKFDLRSGALVGAEGLARWDHPEFGLLAPDAFLDIALMSESIGDFTMKMLGQGIEMIRRSTELGYAISVAVNVAMRTLRDVGFAPAVFAMLGAAGVPPHRLTIEVTESDVLEPSAEMIAALEQLNRGGVGISVDDFGTGHSSLARLKAFRVTELKIDRSFVAQVVHHPRDRHIVRSIIGLANGLGYQVVAEGVERPDQAFMLASMGCPTAQGYLFSKPLPADDFVELVSDSATAATEAKQAIAAGATASAGAAATA